MDVNTALIIKRIDTPETVKDKISSHFNKVTIWVILHKYVERWHNMLKCKKCVVELVSTSKNNISINTK